MLVREKIFLVRRLKELSPVSNLFLDRSLIEFRMHNMRVKYWVQWDLTLETETIDLDLIRHRDFLEMIRHRDILFQMIIKRNLISVLSDLVLVLPTNLILILSNQIPILLTIIIITENLTRVCAKTMFSRVPMHTLAILTGF